MWKEEMQVSQTRELRWTDDLEAAKRAAKGQGKLVLLDFFSPT